MAHDARTGRRLVAPLTTAAALGFASNCALGIRASRRPLGHRSRWLHHALYISTAALTAVAAIAAFATGHRAGIPLAAAGAPLALIPRIPARSPRHPLIAAACAPGFVAALLLTRPERPTRR